MVREGNPGAPGGAPSSQSSAGGPDRGPAGGPRRPGGRGRGRYAPRRKVCAFCVDKVTNIDYKDVGRLRRYISDRGKIEPRRRTGTCARHQRVLSLALKRARHLALLPFNSMHVRELGGGFGPSRG